ncbi:MAG: rane protein [Chthoniobacteraceae bacterium]|nr:rane protein [Chthoniobacteraceae bacterium]
MPDPLDSSAPVEIAKTDSGLSPHVAAGIACIFSLIGGIIFLLLEKKNAFVRFWAMQALLLGIVAFGAAVLFPIAHFILAHLPLIGGLMAFLLWLLYLFFEIAWVVVYLMTIIKAFSGREWELPWLGRLARQQLAKLDARQLPPEI